MARLHSSHLTLDGTADQGEVTDDIQQLVTGRLVVEIEFHIVQDTTFLDRDFRLLEESGDMVKFFGRDIAVDKHDGVGQVAAFNEVTADKSNIPCLQNELSMWLKKPMGFFTLHFPVPSMLRVSEICVSFVFRSTVAVRIMALPCEVRIQEYLLHRAAEVLAKVWELRSF